MNQPAPTTTDVCVNHRQRPRAARCVSCESALCVDCVVRTPVGVKCAACTGDRIEPAPTRPPRRAANAPDDHSRRPSGAWRRAVFPVVVAVLVIAAVAVAVVGIRWATNSPSAPATAPARPDSSDVRVSFTGAGGLQLAGTLTLPAKPFQPAPAVLIVPDAGAVDRDGIIRPGNVVDRLYADLAQSFSARGWATLRYDPRGQGQSTVPSGAWT